MWPSCSGMAAGTYPPGRSVQGLPPQLVRLAAFGAVRRQVDASETGELAAPFTVDINGQPHLAFNIVSAKSWLVFSDSVAEYTLFVGGKPVSIRLPKDFHDFDQGFME